MFSRITECPQCPLFYLKACCYSFNNIMCAAVKRKQRSSWTQLRLFMAFPKSFMNSRSSSHSSRQSLSKPINVVIITVLGNLLLTIFAFQPVSPLQECFLYFLVISCVCMVSTWNSAWSFHVKSYAYTLIRKGTDIYYLLCTLPNQ
jgi:hypothetical protein